MYIDGLVDSRATSSGRSCGRFSEACNTCLCYYDWTGSLQKLPVYFNLINFKGDMLKPVESVGDVKSVLNMGECDNPPPLEEYKEIEISRFSASESIAVKDCPYDMGNEEAQHFLTQLMDQGLDCTPNSPVLLSLKCSCDTEFMIKTYVKNLEEKSTAARILCHRDTVKFWEYSPVS